MPRDTNEPSKRIASKKDSEAHAPKEEEEESDKKKNAELDSDDDDDDDELFNLAQKWADSQGTKGQKGGDEAVAPTKSKKDKQHTVKKRRKSIEANATGTTQECNLSSESNGLKNKPRKQCSLHITNLPYNATKEEIVQAFSNKGCRVISTRLVYNYHTSRRGYDKSKTKTTNSNGFTGVAFVDLADGKSYKLGLEMDKMIWGSQSDADENDQKFGRGWKRRRINVRPTKTKEELAQIVAQTKLKLAAQKQDRKEEHGDKQTLSVEKYTGHNQGRDSSSGKARRSPEKKRKLDKNDDPSSSKKKKKQKSEERKLTKKDRAKKAAILRSKKITK